jgi:hypothetical protein
MTEGTDMGENATAAAVLTQEEREEQAERTHNSRDSSNSGYRVIHNIMYYCFEVLMTSFVIPTYFYRRWMIMNEQPVN